MSLVERLQRQTTRFHRRNIARRSILEHLPFYPAYPPQHLIDMGFTNGQLRRICDRLADNGKLRKHRSDGYDSEKGREKGLVYYTAQSIEGKRNDLV